MPSTQSHLPPVCSIFLGVPLTKIGGIKNSYSLLKGVWQLVYSYILYPPGLLKEFMGPRVNYKCGALV